MIFNPLAAPAEKVRIESLAVRGDPVADIRSGELDVLPAHETRDMGVTVPREVITVGQLTDVDVTFSFEDGRGRQRVDRSWQAPHS